MFKCSSFADEISESMKQILVSNAIDNKYGLSKIAKAADYLNIAAGICDQAGMYHQSDDITNLLKQLSEQLSYKMLRNND
jgi:hypothetical protein